MLGGKVTAAILDLDLNRRIDLVDFNPDGAPFTDTIQERILSASTNEGEIYAAIGQVAKTSIGEAGGLKGEYSVRVDLNGAVSGFGLSAFSRMDGEGGVQGTREDGSAFVLNVDRFVIQGWVPRDPQDWYNPDNNKYKEIQPFIIERVGNESTVGINGKLIVNGSITADSIQTKTLGAEQINTQSLFAEHLEANNIITGKFSTNVNPNMRLEINGEGSSKELYPFWYGRGTTGDDSTSVFCANKDGTMKLAGELYVTGAGKFVAGNYENANEYRIEIGGAEDDFMLWAGSGTKSKSNENYAFWIDRFGEAKFKGKLEAEFVSGEISRQLSILDTNTVTGKRKDNTGTTGYASSDWTDLGEWTLPASPFQAHLPTMTVSFNCWGTGVRAGALRVLWRNGNGGWHDIHKGFINMWEYAATPTVIVSAPFKTLLASTFKLQFVGADGGRWTAEGPITSSRRSGYLLGLRYCN